MSPYIIEFAGMPNTGKTSCIDLVADLYRRHGHTVRVEAERAQVCPFLPTYRHRFATWMADQAARTVARATEVEDQDTLVLVDRGIFDSIAFLDLLCVQGRVNEEERDKLLDVSGIARHIPQVGLVLLFMAKPATCEARDVLTRMFGLPGTITNLATLESLATAYRRTLVGFEERFENIRLVDTDDADPADVLRQVLSYIQLRVAGPTEQEAPPVAPVRESGDISERGHPRSDLES